MTKTQIRPVPKQLGQTKKVVTQVSPVIKQEVRPAPKPRFQLKKNWVRGFNPNKYKSRNNGVSNVINGPLYPSKHLPKKIITHKKLPSRNILFNTIDKPIIINRENNTPYVPRTKKLNKRTAYIKVGNGSFMPTRVSIIPPAPAYPPLTNEERQNIRNAGVVKWGFPEYHNLYKRVREHVTNDPYHNPPRIVNYTSPVKLSNLALPNMLHTFNSPHSPLTKRRHSRSSSGHRTSRSR